MRRRPGSTLARGSISPGTAKLPAPSAGHSYAKRVICRTFAAMITIPAIDIIDGEVVRLTGGDYAQQTTYSSDPVETAREFESRGYTHLHLVDLDGAKASRVVNLDVLERIAAATALHIDFGGGVKDTEQLRRVLDAGAKQVTAGSIAVKAPGTVLGWLDEFGPEVIILGMDVKDARVAVHGWQEKSALDWPKFLDDYHRAGARRVICTDVSRDGMMSGPALELYRDILEQEPDIELVASGGIRDAADLAACQEIGCVAAIVGKALYEGRL